PHMQTPGQRLERRLTPALARRAHSARQHGRDALHAQWIGRNKLRGYARARDYKRREAGRKRTRGPRRCEASDADAARFRRQGGKTRAGWPAAAHPLLAGCLRGRSGRWGGRGHPRIGRRPTGDLLALAGAGGEAEKARGRLESRDLHTSRGRVLDAAGTASVEETRPPLSASKRRRSGGRGRQTGDDDVESLLELLVVVGAVRAG